jgi:hypothetical protein
MSKIVIVIENTTFWKLDLFPALFEGRETFILLWPLERTSITGQPMSKSRLYVLRLTVSRPVLLGDRRPSGTRAQFLFLLEIFFRQLRVCYFVAHSLTRRRLCNLLLLLGLASTVPRDSRPYFIVPILETPPNLEGQVPIFLSPRNRAARIFPRAKSKSHYDRQSVGQFVLVPGDHLGPATNFSISLRFSFRQLLFVML